MSYLRANCARIGFVQTVSVLAGLVLLSAGACLAQTNPVTSTPATGPAATAPTTESAESTPLLFRDSPAGIAPKGGESSPLWYSIASTAVILVLTGLFFMVRRKFLPRLSATGSRRRIQVIETAYLGTRKSATLVRVGKKLLLLGQTREGVTLLADVSNAFDEESARDE
jgi:hypothetical protein